MGGESLVTVIGEFAGIMLFAGIFLVLSRRKPAMSWLRFTAVAVPILAIFGSYPETGLNYAYVAAAVVCSVIAWLQVRSAHRREVA